MWQLDYKESWAPKNWCFWSVVLEKILESSLNCKEINPTTPSPKGDQSWVFIGRTDAKAETLVLWPPDVKNWLIWKDPDAGKDWRLEKKGTTEDEMVGCITNSMEMSVSKLRELVMDKGAGVLQFMWSPRVRHDWVNELKWTESNHTLCKCTRLYRKYYL